MRRRLFPASELSVAEKRQRSIRIFVARRRNTQESTAIEKHPHRKNLPPDCEPQKAAPIRWRRGERPIRQTTNRQIIILVCLQCCKTANTSYEFKRQTNLLKYLICQNSDTPTLDKAFMEGVVSILSYIKGDQP